MTQKHVSDSLDSLKCTRVVVAHRLSTVKNCDRILVVDGGKIAEEGTYDELIAKKGIYYNLYRLQMEAMKNIGSPDLLVLFTNTMSHKMVRCAMNEAKGQKNLRIVYSHASSKAALRSILEEHAC